MHPVPALMEADWAAAVEAAAGLSTSWINNAFSRDAKDERRAIVSPYDNAVLVDIAMGSAAQVDRAVTAAQAALKGPWGTGGHQYRADLIRKLAEAVDAARLEFALLETLDVGKPIQHSYNDDAPTTVGVLRWYASLVETAYDTAPTRRNGIHVQITREPQGVVGIVLPWNYPLTTLALKLGPALAAGNTVVCKPADDTPLSTIRFAQLASDVGFPAGVINVVPGTGAVAGRAIGLHDGIAAINFTGSTATGRRFLHYSADSNLKEISLECGGKNPALLLPDADYDRVADDIATGFMMNSGQLCSSISRILAPRSHEAKLRNVLAEKMAAWPIGNPMNPATRIGPLVSDVHAAKVAAAIDAERGRNNDILVSAAPVTGTSPRLVAPIAIFNVDEDAAVWRDEIFGPVLAVNFYDDIEDAIARANNTAYGLSAYVFGHEVKAISAASEKLEAGFVAVNAFCEGDFTTPFGGFKVSGFGGKDKGIHSLDQYSRIKSTWWAI
jgi:gamma-glutamyl-gamma-aminobutyraldehyde dehydrogenase